MVPVPGYSKYEFPGIYLFMGPSFSGGTNIMYTIYIKTSDPDIGSVGTNGGVNMDIHGVDLSFNTGNLDQGDRDDRDPDRWVLHCYV